MTERGSGDSTRRNGPARSGGAARKPAAPRKATARKATPTRKPAAPRKAAPKPAATRKAAPSGRTAPQRRPAQARTSARAAAPAGGPRAASPRVTGPGRQSRPQRPARPPRRRPSTAPTSSPRSRMRGMTIAILFVLSIFGAQLIRIQGFDSATTAASALSSRTRTEVVPALRGTIYDRKGTVLASSIERRTVTVDQTAVPSYEKEIDGVLTEVGVAGAAADLASLLDMSEASLEDKLDGESRYVVLKKNISPLTWRKINALGIPGIYSERTSQRSYPQSTTAASLVGFVTDDGAAGGGLELLQDETLAGRAGKVTYEIGQDGSRLPNGIYESDSAHTGRDLRLTIDNDLQWYAQNALVNKIKETKALSGTVVVQNAKTGELLALASAPTYDPNDVGNVGSGSLSNLAFSDVFEPGSTAKIMTAAAALEEGVATPTTPMIVPYSLARSDRTFTDSHVHPTEYLTFAGALAQSSNTGIILAGEQVGTATLEKYYRTFGLGSKTGLNFPGESAGLLPKTEDMDGSQRYTVMFGQGLSVTAIQAAGVFQTIANDGVRLPPRLISGIGNEDGGYDEVAAPKGERVVSTKTARAVNTMLEGVVTDEGTAPEARIPGYRVAGKTGTADRYDDTVGGYSGKTASFIGFAPADDPELVVSVILQRPIKGYFGGTVAAPVFKDVMTYALQALQVPPTPEDSKAPKLKLKLSKAPKASTPGLLRDNGNPDRR
ncbi:MULTISPECIES: penicillin-binding transpeptidase domain-containing protein [unclassified Janibacter]|uniref:peptidoglycan D,D-transpeptidase FtsI family protein n=1 Tax=unclassified Janibacter TaxID=2649294 RepID=UPI003D07FD8D